MILRTGTKAAVGDLCAWPWRVSTRGVSSASAHTDNIWGYLSAEHSWLLRLSQVAALSINPCYSGTSRGAVSSLDYPAGLDRGRF